MTYEAELERLYSLDRVVPKVDLSNMERLLEKLGNPHRRIGKVIHIAGTNGKGSTARMCSQILFDNEKKVGLFISPFILDFRERIQVNHEWISKEDVLRLLEKVDAANAKLQLADDLYQATFFEYVTAMMFCYFAEQEIEYAVLECGMGGKLDSTNVCSPVVSLITSIALDHQGVLGDTVEMIAEKKAGIIKKGVPIIVNRENDGLHVIKNMAEYREAPLHVLKPTDKLLSLKGEFQKSNAALAVKAMELLGFEIGVSLTNVQWPGRLELKKIDERTTLLLDCAHNVAAMKAVKPTIKKIAQEYDHVSIIFGCTKGKDAEGMLAELPKHDQLYLVRIPSARSWERELELEDALEQATKYGGLIMILGSCYLASEMRKVTKCQQIRAVSLQ